MHNRNETGGTSCAIFDVDILYAAVLQVINKISSWIWRWRFHLFSPLRPCQRNAQIWVNMVNVMNKFAQCNEQKVWKTGHRNEQINGNN